MNKKDNRAGKVNYPHLRKAKKMGASCINHHSIRVPKEPNVLHDVRKR